MMTHALFLSSICCCLIAQGPTGGDRLLERRAVIALLPAIDLPDSLQSERYTQFAWGVESANANWCLLILGTDCLGYGNPCTRFPVLVGPQGYIRMLPAGEYDSGRVADSGLAALARGERVKLWSPVTMKETPLAIPGVWAHVSCTFGGPLTIWDFVPGTDVLVVSGPPAGGKKWEDTTSLVGMDGSGTALWDLDVPGQGPLSITFVDSVLTVQTYYESSRFEYRMTAGGVLLSHHEIPDPRFQADVALWLEFTRRSKLIETRNYEPPD
jgi:hypothetical protein